MGFQRLDLLLSQDEDPHVQEDSEADCESSDP